jgi:formate hydrogenlyase subunit 4
MQTSNYLFQTGVWMLWASVVLIVGLGFKKIFQGEVWLINRLILIFVLPLIFLAGRCLNMYMLANQEIQNKFEAASMSSVIAIVLVFLILWIRAKRDPVWWERVKKNYTK